MFDNLKQLQELRKQAKELENQLSSEEVIGESGTKRIQVVLDGNQKIKNIVIEDVLLSPDKKPEIEEELIEAFNDGLDKVKKIMASKIQNSSMNPFGQ